MRTHGSYVEVQPIDKPMSQWIRVTEVIWVMDAEGHTRIGRKDQMPIDVNETVEDVLKALEMAENPNNAVLLTSE